MLHVLTSLIQPSRSFTVPYPQTPELPNGAADIFEHVPLAEAALQVRPQQFRLVSLPAHEAYDAFADQHPELRFADALFFQAFLAALAPNGKRSRRLERAFLGDFSGQIFFLGTAFDSEAGLVYPFFDWTSMIQPGRYLCPTGHPVRPDLPVFAAVYEAREGIR